jgi:hypothetical protein
MAVSTTRIVLANQSKGEKEKLCKFFKDTMKNSAVLEMTLKYKDQ